MTKEKWLEIIKLIASFAVGVATIVLAQSCISSWNINKNSKGATINSKQSAEQKNDSTNFKIELKNVNIVTGKTRFQSGQTKTTKQ